ncbi:Hypothetical predicted protein [Marmota monax]|uniref:LIM zinc-binding domain-containing protein n=1 Tax=Marmota monax TaxID=9995 RepID=A0A5E4CJN4_MARMO|nr:Hypothetical predicted protein [Marmota monax]
MLDGLKMEENFQSAIETSASFSSLLGRAVSPKSVCEGCQRVISDRFLLRLNDSFWHEQCVRGTLSPFTPVLLCKAKRYSPTRPYLEFRLALGICTRAHSYQRSPAEARGTASILVTRVSPWWFPPSQVSRLLLLWCGEMRLVHLKFLSPVRFPVEFVDGAQKDPTLQSGSAFRLALGQFPAARGTFRQLFESASDDLESRFL